MIRKEYAVKAEAFDGRIVIIKRGFRSRVSAEDTQIRHADWKRVWISEIPRTFTGEDTAALPWRIEWSAGHAPSHVVDANGGKLAILTGSIETRESFANNLAELMAVWAGEKSTIA